MWAVFKKKAIWRIYNVVWIVEYECLYIGKIIHLSNLFSLSEKKTCLITLKSCIWPFYVSKHPPYSKIWPTMYQGKIKFRDHQDYFKSPIHFSSIPIFLFLHSQKAHFSTSRATLAVYQNTAFFFFVTQIQMI